MGYADFKQFDEADFAFRNSKGKVKQAPDLPENVSVADTHCHLNMLDNPGLAIARAAMHGVAFMCCITDPSERPESAGEDSTRLTALQTYDMLEAWRADARAILDAWGACDTELPYVRMACGVHPHNARLWEGASDTLADLLKRPETCCLGEIGLDYHYDFSPRDVQRDVFARQLRIAHEAHVPVSLHLREAHADALEILQREGVPEAGCILHCFNLGAEDLEPFLDLGCYIALGGPLTFKKSWYTRAAVAGVPLNRLLTETDAPYMAPEPLRGTVCAPDQTVYTLRMLLDCFGYRGDDRARELMQPRQIDIENGVEAPQAEALDFAKLQCGNDELAFCKLVYANALRLLGDGVQTKGAMR